MSQNPGRIIDLASAFYDSCILFAASDLEIFKKLADLGTATADTLAEELKFDERCTRLLMDGCVAVGLLVKDNDLYQNTPESSAFLVPGRPGDLSGAIRYNRDVYSAWGNLARMVQTGKPAERQEVHLGQDANRTRNFVMAMHGRALWIGRVLIPLMDLHSCKQLLDIGGGPGTFSVLIAERYPDITCTVLDLPDITEIAGDLIEQQGMSRRVATLPGDYHKVQFPAGNDVVNILGVLHQESPESIQDILNRAFDALISGGLIHIMDIMTDASHTNPKFSALFAVNMALTSHNGWVFSDKELKQWLTTAGFSHMTVQPLPSPMPHWLVTARKV
jgi:ubiquinone/menaquinone biosynthesis C-methylase UbiE